MYIYKKYSVSNVLTDGLSLYLNLNHYLNLGLNQYLNLYLYLYLYLVRCLNTWVSNRPLMSHGRS